MHSDDSASAAEQSGLKSEPASNRLKFPITVLGIVVALVVTGIGISSSSWWVAAVALLFVVIFVLQIHVIRQGRNPWWNRAPADYQRSSRGRDA
jgi:membrane protein YdbS with pleckstrin-like domain